MTVRAWSPVAVGLVLSVCACGENHDPRAEVSFDTPQSRALSPDPMFKIPGVEIDGDSIFIHRIMPGTFTDDGEIAVALTQGEFQVLYVDTLGTAIDLFGRTGEGPGEFRRLTHVTANADTVAAWDRRNGRVSLFADRQPVTQFSVPIPPSDIFVGMLSTGHVVTTPKVVQLTGQRFVAGVAAGAPRPYSLIDRDGEGTVTYLGPPDAGSSTLAFVPTVSTAGATSFQVGPTCLPETLHLTVDDQIVIADSRSGRLYAMGPTGTVRTLYETRYRDNVRQDLIDFVERAVEWAEESRSMTSASKKDARETVGRLGDPLPAVWSGMVADQDGGVWLQRASCDLAGTASTTWEVLDSDWTLQGTVSVPADIRVLSVRGDLVLAAITSFQEIPYLALYRVSR